ncbi:MAG: B12-binding domain-containing radical SAM protein [Methanobacteriaceae archaeon]|nr:B12-binding domain-containing radical SAM protein [Methanobacteriaceae archaeon]
MEIILTADETLTTTYRDLPLADFLGCAPPQRIPPILYKFIDTQVPHKNGRLTFAPYSLRKIEAALLKSYKDVVVAHPQHIEKFIKEDTRIVAVTTMDPLGLGPVTMIFTEGGRLPSYTRIKFTSLIKKINKYRQVKGLDFKIVVGGPGAWQLEVKEDEIEELGIDHLIIGETEHQIIKVFREIEDGYADKIIHVKGWPSADEIPTIVNPSYKGMIEVMRGCGRGCKFCDPNIRKARFYPMEKIIEEVEVNSRAGQSSAWLHSEDIFNYMIEDKKHYQPNEDAVIRLFREVLKRVDYANPTHGNVSGALAAPRILEKVAELNDANLHRWVGIQVGLETASPTLLEKIGSNKVKPFDASEWPWVLLNGTYAFNKYFWFPAYTTIVGLPGETEEDEINTARLIITMREKLREELGEKAHFIVVPLAFVPMGLLKGEEFFDVDNQLTPGRLLHIYHAWRQILWELEHGFRIVKPGIVSFLFSPLIKLGLKFILRGIEKWAARNGVDVKKPLEPMDIKLERF